MLPDIDRGAFRDACAPHLVCGVVDGAGAVQHRDGDPRGTSRSSPLERPDHRDGPQRDGAGACARRLYQQLEVNRGLPAALLVKYFDRVGADWQIKDEHPEDGFVPGGQSPRSLAAVLAAGRRLHPQRPHLLRHPDEAHPPRRVRESLRADGYLVLGGAETTMNLDDQLVSLRSSSASMLYQHAKAAALAAG